MTTTEVNRETARYFATSAHGIRSLRRSILNYTNAPAPACIDGRATRLPNDSLNATSVALTQILYTAEDLATAVTAILVRGTVASQDDADTSLEDLLAEVAAELSPGPPTPPPIAASRAPTP